MNKPARPSPPLAATITGVSGLPEESYPVAFADTSARNSFPASSFESTALVAMGDRGYEHEIRCGGERYLALFPLADLSVGSLAAPM
ncbi:hypothetical protein PM082_014555 [Marasmius tenuissimus]|nr:hypothetical protein PM082_014555 [Marasmius tenuissimus]